MKDFSIYSPIFGSIGFEPITMVDLFGHRVCGSIKWYKKRSYKRGLKRR